MQQYYRLGTLDNCTQKWSALWACLSLKTKPSSEVQVCGQNQKASAMKEWNGTHSKIMEGNLPDRTAFVSSNCNRVQNGRHCDVMFFLMYCCVNNVLYCRILYLCI